MQIHDAPAGEPEIIDLLTRMKPRLRRIMASFRIPMPESEDLLQDACLALVRHWQRIDCPEAWLAQTLSRLCCHASLRRRRAWLHYFDGAILEAIAPAQRPEQERAELYSDLKTLAVLLPTRHRLILWLRYGLGMSTEEIAIQLGSRAGTVRKHSARALARLRRAVQGARG
jgi:RNA polymerase sigma factor (sigma-70 family)